MWHKQTHELCVAALGCTPTRGQGAGPGGHNLGSDPSSVATEL